MLIKISNDKDVSKIIFCCWVIGFFGILMMYFVRPYREDFNLLANTGGLIVGLLFGIKRIWFTDYTWYRKWFYELELYLTETLLWPLLGVISLWCLGALPLLMVVVSFGSCIGIGLNALGVFT